LYIRENLPALVAGNHSLGLGSRSDSTLRIWAGNEPPRGRARIIIAVDGPFAGFPGNQETGREFLKKDRLYFVRLDGGEKCDGRANVAEENAKWWWSSCAFRRWNQTVEIVTGTLDFANRDVRIINGNGATYNEGVEIKSPWVGGGRLIFDFGGGGLAPEKYIAFRTGPH